MKKIKSPLTKKDTVRLKAGDKVLFTGTLYTARDQAHKRLVELIKKKKRLPVNIKNEVVYYCGPTATPSGSIIGSCGPTTSSRMDSFVEPLLKKGLLAMIGKGRRSKEVRNLIKKNKALYLVAPSGCGALLAKQVKLKKTICFKDLGAEGIFKLKVEDFPLVVGIDARGRSIYDDVP